MMGFAPRVSIVIPVFNGSDYLKEALESALSQTYRNIEILVINDGSTDGGKTQEIALTYGERIRYFCKENGGVASALNLGIREMTGEYFSWLSHDDVYYPQKIERQIDYLRKLLNKKVFLYSDYECIDDQSRYLFSIRADHKELLKKPLYAVLRGNIHGCSVLVPRIFLIEAGLFSEELKTTQDYHLWFKIARKCKIAHIPEVLIKYRVHPEQGSLKIPAHVDEGNDLWIDFMTSLSYEEMLKCEKTLFLFYLKMAEHLSKSPYFKAHDYAVHMAECSIDNKLVNMFAYLFSKVELRIPEEKLSYLLRILKKLKSARSFGRF